MSIVERDLCDPQPVLREEDRSTLIRPTKKSRQPMNLDPLSNMKPTTPLLPWRLCNGYRILDPTCWTA